MIPSSNRSGSSPTGWGTIALLLLALSSPPREARAGSPAPPTATGLDLPTAYALALRQSETLALSDEAIVQAQEAYRQALDGVPPRLSLHGQDQWQDTAGIPPAFRNFFLASQPQAQAKIHLPSLTGYRELAGLDAADSFVGSARYSREATAQALYLTVAQAFYAAFQNGRDLATSVDLERLTRDRIKELEARIFVGRSRDSEQVQVESQLASLEAAIESLSRARQAGFDLLSFLVGRTVVPPLVDPSPLPGRGDPSDLDRVIEAARRHPQLRAVEEQVRMLRSLVKVSWSGHLPVWSFDANLYGYRTGVLENSRWDALLQVDIPVFSWGQVASQVRTAESQLRSGELALQLARRSLELQARSAWEDLQSALEELVRLERAAALAQRNYDLQVRDYRRGLVSNLDVLQGLNNLLQARILRDDAEVRVRLSRAALAVATGEVPAPTGGTP